MLSALAAGEFGIWLTYEETLEQAASNPLVAEAIATIINAKKVFFTAIGSLKFSLISILTCKFNAP
jgi:hypothetical protein